MVGLVSGAASERRRATLEVHERRFSQRLGLALHRLPNNAVVRTAQRDVGPHGVVPAVLRPRDLSAGPPTADVSVARWR